MLNLVLELYKAVLKLPKNIRALRVIIKLTSF